MEIGISRVYNVLMVLKWRNSEKREPIFMYLVFHNYNFVRDIVISLTWELMCVSWNQYDCFMCSFIIKRGPDSD